jgi:hypothetical protein
MNLIDFLSMGGQERRKMLDNYVDSLNLERFVPPNLRPATEFIAEANPVAAMGGAMQDASVVFDPAQTAEARKRAAVDMGLEMAMTLAPAALVRMGYLAAPAGLAETFGMSIDNAAENARGLISDATYAARSVAEGDPRGVLEAFQRGGTPQSVGAAGIGDNGGPALNEVPRIARQYSPSRRAAENLKQNKGTYKQMRAMLLKGGAKENELEWSGLDERFKSDDTVTKEQIIKWLTASDPRLDRQVRESYGTIGAEPPSHEQMIDQYVEQNLSDEAYYYLTEYGPERLNDEYRPITDLDEDELIDVAAYEGYDEDQIDDFLKDYEDYWIDDAQELFSNEDAALAHALGGYDTPAEGAEALARDALDENARYNMDFDELRESLGLDEAEEFYEDETQYGADYFPSGASDYRENIYKFEPEDDSFPPERVTGASHFGEDDDFAQFHTRTGILPLSNTGGQQRAYYVGEIQSDAQQNLNKDSLLSYAEGMKLKDYDALGNSLMSDSNRFNMAATTNEQAIRQTVGDIMTDANATVSDGLGAQQEIYNIIYKQAVLDDHNARMVNSGQTPMPSKLSELNADQLNQINGLIVTPDIQRNIGQSEYKLTRALLENPNILPQENPITAQVLMPQIIERANNLNRSKAYAHTASDQERFFIEDNPELESKMFSGVGGPVMGSQNQWLDYALRSELLEAVNDPSVDYFALPYSEYAIGKVGGTSSPKQGTIDFYRRDVPNRLKKILKQNNIDVGIGPIRLEGEAYGDSPIKAQGVWLRPEIKDQIKRSGLPTFAAIGALPLMGVLDYLQEQKEKRNERFGGLMGYGGL